MDTCTITIAGRFQQGKSTLVNCLLEGKFAETGNGLRTTACCTYYHNISRFELKPAIKVNIPWLRDTILVDTPGFNVNANDDEIATEAIETTDYVVLLLAEKTVNEVDEKILRKSFELNKRIVVLFNCTNTDIWHPSNKKNKEICQTIESYIENIGWANAVLPVNGRKVWPCNLAWAWLGRGHHDDDFERKLRMDDDYPRTPNALLDQSGFLPVLRTLQDIRLCEALHFMDHIEQEIECITNTWERHLESLISKYLKGTVK